MIVSLLYDPIVNDEDVSVLDRFKDFDGW